MVGFVYVFRSSYKPIKEISNLYTYQKNLQFSKHCFGLSFFQFFIVLFFIESIGKCPAPEFGLCINETSASELCCIWRKKEIRVYPLQKRSLIRKRLIIEKLLNYHAVSLLTYQSSFLPSEDCTIMHHVL